MNYVSDGPQDEPGREATREGNSGRFEELELVLQQLKDTTERMRRMGLEPNLALITNMITHVLQTDCTACFDVLCGG